MNRASKATDSFTFHFGPVSADSPLTAEVTKEAPVALVMTDAPRTYTAERPVALSASTVPATIRSAPTHAPAPKTTISAALRGVADSARRLWLDRQCKRSNAALERFQQAFAAKAPDSAYRLHEAVRMLIDRAKWAESPKEELRFICEAIDLYDRPICRAIDLYHRTYSDRGLDIGDISKIAWPAVSRGLELSRKLGKEPMSDLEARRHAAQHQKLNARSTIFNADSEVVAAYAQCYSQVPDGRDSADRYDDMQEATLEGEKAMGRAKRDFDFAKKQLLECDKQETTQALKMTLPHPMPDIVNNFLEINPVRDLTTAAAEGNLDEVRTMLFGSSAVNVCDAEGYSPLMWAAQNGHLAIVELLLENGATPETSGARVGYENSLYLAVRGGHEQVALALIAKSANPIWSDAQGNSVISAALQTGSDALMIALEQAPAGESR